MRVSPKGLVALARKEGIVVAPYKDSVGVWTWGVGHTAGAGDPDPARMDKAMPAAGGEFNDAVAAALDQFAKDLHSYEDRVMTAVKVPLAQHEFDALVSFDFNTGGIFRAKLTQALNRGDRAGAARGFMGWLRPKEIRGRRQQEQDLFETGVYSAGRVPIYGTDGAGNLRGVKRSMESEDLLTMMAEFGRGGDHVAPPVAVDQLPPRPAPSKTVHVGASKGRESPLQSTTIWAQIKQWGAAAVPTGLTVWQALQEQDPIVKGVILGGTALAALYMLHLGRHIIKERMDKWFKGVK